MQNQPQTHQREPGSGVCFNPMKHMMVQLIYIQERMMTINLEREAQQTEIQRAHIEDTRCDMTEKRSRQIKRMKIKLEMEEKTKCERQQKLAER